jgi:hypothetical protein
VAIYSVLWGLLLKDLHFSSVMPQQCQHFQYRLCSGEGQILRRVVAIGIGAVCQKEVKFDSVALSMMAAS